MPDSTTGDTPVEINLLLRGQSNMGGLAVLNRWTGSKALASDVAQLLGFVAGRDKVNIVFDHNPSDGSTTAIGGTAFLRDWIEPINGDWRNGWQLDYGSRQLLKAIEQTIARNAHPTAVVWLHNESDSYLPGGMPAPTVEQWIDGVKWEASLVRAAAGRSAADMPYVFVSAIPYISVASANQTIRAAMETITEDASFNARIGARSTDLDQNNDNPTHYGGAHNSWQDGLLLAKRLALVVAEQFAHLARPGSPIALANGNIASEGPKVIAAAIVDGQPDALAVQLRHDVVDQLSPLSPVAALGAAWSARPTTGTAITATAVEIITDTLLKITFAKPLTTDMKLFFGWGNARSAIGNAPGQGNAIYDEAGLPVWTDPRGVAITTGGSLAVNRAPTDIVFDGIDRFLETAAAGLALGSFRAIDPDAGDTASFRLLDDAQARFTLDPVTGSLSIADGAVFDHDAEQSVSIIIEARDAGGLAHVERFTWMIDQVPDTGPQNLPPADIIVDGPGTFRENAAPGLAIATVRATDPDPGDSVSLRLLDDAGGRLVLDAATGEIRINPGAVFSHSAEPNVTIVLEAQDAGGLALTETFTFVVERAFKPAGLPAQLIVTSASSFGRGPGVSFELPAVEAADGSPTSASWTNAAMGLNWAPASGTIAVKAGDGAIEARAITAWDSIKGLWLADDAASITVGNIVDVAITSLASAGATIRAEAMKRGMIKGGAGADTILIEAFSNAASPAGAAWQNQIAVLAGAGDDHIAARDWNGWTSFVIDAGAGNDTIIAGGGNDVLRGNSGFDTITGGAGADRFIMRIGNGRSGDVITDFNAAEGDVLVFEGVAPSSVTWSAGADGVLVRYGSADTLLLQGVLSLDAAGILFV